MRNPVLEEAAEVYIRRREYLTFHLVYVAGIALFTILVWPARGFMYFFRTETVPAVFQATIIAQVIVITGVSLYAGLDRLAEAQIIRYSEWLERTTLPVSLLFQGKMLAGTVHTLFFVVAGLPFAVIAAGPSGVTVAAVLASELILLLAGLIGRVAGMLISHVGETRYVVRVVGGWIFVALLFVLTVQTYQPLNPIFAVIAQHGEDSPFMAVETAADPAVSRLAVSRLADNPLVASAVPLLAVALILAALFRLSLTRHRKTALGGANV